MARRKKEPAAPVRWEDVPEIPKAEEPYPLPEGWKWVYGKNILGEEENATLKGEFFNYIDIESIDNNLQNVKTPKKIAVKDAPSRAKRKLHFGDTIFSMVRPYLKNIAYIDKHLSKCIASTGFYVCRPTMAIDSSYLFWLMTSDYVVNGLNSYMRGDNSPSIRKEHILNFIYPLPPLDIQQRIASRIESLFSQLDEAAEKVQTVIDSHEARKQAILHRAFSGELTKKWRTEQKISFSAWENKDFSELVVNSRIGLIRSMAEQGMNFEYKYLKMNNISQDGKLLLDDLITVNASTKEQELFELKYGDFLFNTRNSMELVGKSSVFNSQEKNILFNNNVMRIRFTTEINPFYINYFFHSPRGKKQLDKLKKNTTNVAAIYTKDLNLMSIPIPPFLEQQQIVRHLDTQLAAEEQAKEAAKMVLVKIEQIKKFILAKAFSGELI